VLDVDANAHAADATATPVENAAWADPPAGTYQIFVVPYEMREAASSAFRITIRQQGQPDRVAQGSAVKGSGPVQVATVQVARP
jgi:hypothetical protein